MRSTAVQSLRRKILPPHFIICDGMKSFSNWRWADRNVSFNVPRGTRECCNTLGWPKVKWFDDGHEVTPPICD